jgi:hypothetical protein
MKSNPVLRESIDIFFVEGHGFAVYFYILVILAPVEFLSLYLPSLDAQMWSGSASLFKVTAVTTLLLTVYFAMRVANQEFASWRFRTLKRWHRENGQPIAAISQAQPVLAPVDLGSRHRADAVFDGGAHLRAVVFLCLGLRHLGAVRINVVGAPCRKSPSFHSLFFLYFDDSLTAGLLAA